MYGLQYYLQINIFSIIILVMILTIISIRKKVEYEYILFKNILILSILFCITDILSFLFRGTSFNCSYIIILITNSFYFLFQLLIGYYWNKFVYFKLDEKSLNNSRIKIINLVPLIIGTILLIYNVFSKSLFVINSDNLYVCKEKIYLFMIISWIYIIQSTIKAFKVYFNTKNICIKKKAIPFCLFIIAPIITSIIQILIYGVSALQMGFTISSLLVFLFYQEEEISIDKLTKINNRNSFNEYIQNKFNDIKDNQIISLMFIDVDEFKKINDKYGHIVGDNLLVHIATILKNTCDSFNKDLFLARYGGDEFVIVSLFNKDIMEKLENKINQNIILENLKEDKYNIKVSIGYVSDIKSNFKSLGNMIKIADKKMYKNKINNKQIYNIGEL